MDSFEPKFNESHRFAVAVPAKDGCVMTIATYPTREALKIGYASWHRIAEERNIAKPVPIELKEKLPNGNYLFEILRDVLPTA